MKTIAVAAMAWVVSTWLGASLIVPFIGQSAPGTGGDTDIWTQILGGALGSSPVAIVLWVQLERAQKRLDAKDAQITETNRLSRENDLAREREMREREKELIARVAPLFHESSRAYEEGMRSELKNQKHLDDVVRQLTETLQEFRSGGAEP